MIKEYFEKVEYHTKDFGEKTIVLWECGSFFEVYGLRDPKTGTITPPTILTFAKICDFRIANKKNCIGKKNVVMAGFNNNILDKYLKKLDDAGFTVPIYTQEKKAGIITRSLRFISSPGTYLTKENQQLTNNIMCCWIERYATPTLRTPYISCGISNIDIFTGKSHLFEFQRENLHQSTTYDELERFYSIYNPNEVIIITRNFIETEIQEIIQFAGIQCTNIHKVSLEDENNSFSNAARNCEKQIYQEAQLKYFYDIKDYAPFVESLRLEEYPLATYSFCFLLEFIKKHNPALVKKIHEPMIDNINDRLLLANHSLQQLNILDNHQHKGKCSSILSFMNCCKTAMGKRALNGAILHPITNCEILAREYSIVEHVIDNFETLESIRESFSHIRDIEKLYRKIFMKHVTPCEFMFIYHNVQTTLDVYKIIAKDPILMKYMKDHIDGNVERSCAALITLLEKTFDIDKASQITSLHLENNCFKTGFSPELDTIEGEYERSVEGLQKIQSQLCHKLEKLEKKTPKNPFVKINITEKSMYSLVCTNRRAKLLEGALKKSKKGPFHFYLAGKSNKKIDSKEISSLCSTIHKTFSQLREQLAVEYDAFLERIKNEGEHIQVIVKYITRLDMLLSKAYIAKRYNYCKPEIDMTRETAFFEAKDLRHPLIEHLQKSEIYVPNDISLGGDNCGTLLFGTNAVGKSSLIRSIGIAIVLAQSGMFVPCSSFVYRPYMQLFTRILGNDNIFKGLSTFAVEMSELRTILNMSTENSLILGDELCSGTETTSALKIFAAGIIRLHERNANFIFATHFHEVTHMKEIIGLEHLNMSHMSVIYNREKDQLIYERKLKVGPGRHEYGLEVCKALSLPQDFMDLAHSLNPRPNLLSQHSSHYNAAKLKGGCEVCGDVIGNDIHHLQHQQHASEDGFIKHFHKNHKANLINICKSCHIKIHESDKEHRLFKTSTGMEILETT